MHQPYTYYLYHKPTKQHYYGVRWAKNCHPNDLFVTYFSSSKKIKELISKYGINTFTFKVRKIFNNKQEAILWEHKVLTKLNVNNRKDWLNQNISGSIVYDVHPLKGKHHTIETKAKISNSRKGFKHSEKSKNIMSESRKGEKHWNYNKKHSEESKNKNRESNIKWRKNNPDKINLPPNRKNCIHSMETKNKMSEARKLYWHLRKTASISGG